MSRGRVLVVEDDVSMRDMLVEALGRRQFDVTATGDAAVALACVLDRPFDVVVTDLNMRGMNGLELCERVVDRRPEVPVIVITAFGSLDTAVAAIRVGAYDFLTKPIEMDALSIALDRAVQHHALRDEVRRLRRVVAETGQEHGMIGRSEPMRELYELIDRVADTNASVLLTGESGTGKELVARALHARSPRAAGPYVALNCAALPEALLESELFGHARGAFTDARQARVGVLLRATGGTVLLDEIGDMPVGLQPKLLRVLEQRQVRPVGGDAEVDLDVRIVASTNQDLERAVEAGRFRADLFYRLDVVRIHLPPLRERAGDVLVLAQRFLEEAASASGRRVVGFSDAAARKLTQWHWPGNVRELRNTIERAVLLARADHLGTEDLPARLVEYGSRPLAAADAIDDVRLSIDEVERRHVSRVLESVGGNKQQAARVLGVDRRTLYRKLARWGTGDDGDGEPEA